MPAQAPPEPAFAEPWHALLFALTVGMNEAGHFAWTDWAARFSQCLARHGLSRSLNGGDDYFLAWLETLEQLLDERDAASPSEAAAMKRAWEEAYLRTPHGQPVHLADAPPEPSAP